MTESHLRETAASYDRIVASYEAQVVAPAPERTGFRDRFVAAVVRDGVVVDVGCGPGADVSHFGSCGLRVIGVDSSPGMAARVRERGGAAVVADARRLPVARGSLDAVWSSASLLHVPRADTATTLAGWAHALRPGGALGLITSLGEDEGWEAVPYEPAAQHRGVELRRWFVHRNRASLEDDVQRAGFVLEHVEVRESHRRWLQVLARWGR